MQLELFVMATETAELAVDYLDFAGLAELAEALDRKIQFRGESMSLTTRKRSTSGFNDEMWG